MVYTEEKIGSICVSVSQFIPVEGGRAEVHAVFKPSSSTARFLDVTERLHSALMTFLSERKAYKPVFVRVFLSDVTNQAETVYKVFSDVNCALSVIGQAPLTEGVKIALLVILTENVTVESAGEFSYSVRRGNYSDLWSIVPACPGKNSYEATAAMFESLETALGASRMSIAGNCIRTWFFVRDIDNRYMGMVKARNEFFARCGLTSDTHFIASTGIEGSNRQPDAVVTLEALSTANLLPGQIKYINAPTHLNHTSGYGVAFERATAVDYGDRRHVIVSGTASINNKGEIVAPGNIEAQCARMADNVEALLEQAGANAGNLTHIVVYVRDIADHAVVEQEIRKRYPEVPCIIVNAAVCRPGWLVEMECMAVVQANNPSYAVY